MMAQKELMQIEHILEQIDEGLQYMHPATCSFSFCINSCRAMSWSSNPINVVDVKSFVDVDIKFGCN